VTDSQSGSEENVADYKRAMALQGVEVTRLRLAQGLPIIRDAFRSPPPGLAAEWVAEQDRKKERRESRRFWSVLIFTVIAALAAVVAAIPVVWPPAH
jgi:hypothetical protein